MPSSFDDSDSDYTPNAKLFGHQRSIHSILGGGKVADVILWRDRKVSAGLLLIVGVIWFLFEVADYNLVTLFCHISITTMLVTFLWSKADEHFQWNLPKIPKPNFQESELKIISTIHERFNNLLSRLVNIACGRDLPNFILAIVFLYVLSVIGTYFSFVNLVFFGSLCIETLPFLYERYEDDVDYMVVQVMRNTRKMYKRFDAEFLNKIPRGPVKDKKKL